jgi:hypothetical protein
MGWIADLPDAERLPLLDKVHSLLRAPEYRREWETHVYWTRKTSRIDSPTLHFRSSSLIDS